MAKEKIPAIRSIFVATKRAQRLLHMDEWIWLNLCEIVNTMKPLYFKVGRWLEMELPASGFPSADLC